MSRSDISLEQRPVDWYTEDQDRWWDDQRRDEEELQQMQEQVLRDQIKREIEKDFLENVIPEIEEAINHFARFVFKTGFFLGFVAALGGAVLYFCLT